MEAKAKFEVLEQETSAPQEIDADPEQEDIDDLDDVLEDFSPADKEKLYQDQNKGQKVDQADGQHASDMQMDPEAFSKELHDQMTAFLNGSEASPEMQQQIGNLMSAISADAAAEHSENDGATSNQDSKVNEGSFQNILQKTMDRIETSKTKTSAASSSTGDDILAQMLESMQGGTADGNEDESFDKMLLEMMQQLTNKDILYDPMKELHVKFPAWLEKNHSQTKAEDLARYTKQQAVVTQIVQRFEEAGYSDSNSADREFVVEKMQEMQSLGSPPEDLVGGMEAAESLSDLDSGCTQQ